MWNPPLTTRRAARGARRSARRRSCSRELVARRRAHDLLHEVAQGRRAAQPARRDELRDADPELAELIVPYRAGYTPQQRRELEGRLMRGELRAVITTDALELGIDVGELDAAVVVTFPGTVASLRQMWGRAGRRGRGPGRVRRRRGRARPVLLPPPRGVPGAPGRGGDPRPREPADLRRAPAVRRPRGRAGRAGRGVPRAPLGGVRRRQRRASAPGASGSPPSGAHDFVLAACRAGDYPAAEVSLRSASPDSFAIVDVPSGELLGQTEAVRAHSTVHDGRDLSPPGPLL